MFKLVSFNLNKFTQTLSIKASAFILCFAFPALVWAQTAPAAPGAAPVGATPPPGPSFLMQLPMILLFVGLFYFIMIAPQKKQQKQVQDFQKTLSRGDEVITTSGIIGRIAGITEKVVTLEVCEGTELRVVRDHVIRKLKDMTQAEVKA